MGKVSLGQKETVAGQGSTSTAQVVQKRMGIIEDDGQASKQKRKMYLHSRARRTVETRWRTVMESSKKVLVF